MEQSNASSATDLQLCYAYMGESPQRASRMISAVLGDNRPTTQDLVRKEEPIRQ